jgi:hypothetical protein
MNSRNFFAELKRRNVYKVAVAYAVENQMLVDKMACLRVIALLSIEHASNSHPTTQ